MYHDKEIKEVFEELNTSEKGLSEKEAEERLKKYGLNEIEEGKKTSPFMILVNQFKNFLIYILFAAVIISIIVGYQDYLEHGGNLIKHFIDSIVILIILILIGVIGFIQEYRAEKAIEALKKLASLKAKVIRDGEEKVIDVNKLVPGDLVILQAGDKIPADSRIVELHNLATQEAALTGESVPVKKELKVLAEKAQIADQKNMVFSGTIITNGRGRAIVTGTGMKTEIGKIASMIQGVKPEPTPLQVKLEKLGKKLGILVIAISVVVFIGGVLKGIPLRGMFMTAVSLAVAAVPEGLPAVVVVSLAIGAKKMVKRNALIRKLPSVETLGSTTVICSDKTGTLTKNEMTVRKIYAHKKIIEVTGSGYDPEGDFLFEGKRINPKEILLLLRIGALNNDALLNDKTVIGDPTEGSLIVSAAKAGLEKEELEKKSPRIDEIEFTSERKMMTTIHEINGEKVAYVKGAPEVILKHCNSVYDNGKVRKLTNEEKKKILDINTEFADSALRVLGFAYRTVFGKVEEKNLTFVGLQGMIDPPREEVKLSIEKCKKAGIKVVMITGDHQITAKAIAKELGIDGKSMVGSDLEKIGDLENIVEDIAIYARVNPEHKIKIVDALKKKGHIVAMTGDGVNDAPALKKADIGTAMGIAGTDVAKEASEMILTDDNFSSIVNAIEEGRRIFDNIKKFLALLLSGNIGEVLIIFLAILIGFTDPETGAFVLPLLAIQILWINLVTDGLPALALAVDPIEPGIMDRAPRSSKESIFKGLNAFIFGYPVVMFLGVMLIFATTLASDGVVKAQTMVFTSIIIFELFQAFSCRSLTKPSFKVGIFANKYLLGAVVLSVLLHLAILYTGFFQNVFRVIPLGLYDWGIILLVASTGFIYLEIHKLVAMKRRKC